MLRRRDFLVLLLAPALLVAVETLTAGDALAKDGDGHDSDGHDSDGHDDNGHDDDGHDDDGGTGKNASGDQDEALAQRLSGRIMPLKQALKLVDARVPGKVIDVKLSNGTGRTYYRVKVRRQDGVISTIRLDAKSGRIINRLGF
jgi:uncharacterized membrane protein YkoI